MEAGAIAFMVKLFENHCFYKPKTLESHPKVNGSDPGETRTHDQWLKRPLLYQLSYRIKIYILPEKAVAKLRFS